MAHHRLAHRLKAPEVAKGASRRNAVKQENRVGLIDDLRLKT